MNDQAGHSPRSLWALTAVLFLLSAWPLALVQVLPYQDLPNHLASIHVLWHPQLYPEFVANGFFKTNAALFAWLYWAGQPLGLHAAAKVFALGVLFANAYTYPRLVLELTGSAKKALVASFFLWPMVHNWWVSMGMLDYALGIPLSLWLLILAHRQWRAPKLGQGVAILLVSLACWYAHCFALLVAGLLILIEGTRMRADARVPVAQLLSRFARHIALPLVPASALAAYSTLAQLTEPHGAMTGYAELRRMLPNWELVYHMWAEWCCGFGWRTITSFAVVAGGVWGLTRIRHSVAFFSGRAMLVLAVMYAFAPYSLTNWFHVSSRFIPYIWLGLLLRLPEQLPKWATRGMLVAAALYSVGLGVEYKKLDEDRREFVAAIDAVPQGARLLPMLFTRKNVSEHTQSLLHAWGYYVLAKSTSAPLLFAHSRAFPVMYRVPPPTRFNHLVLESLPVHMRTTRAFCERSRANSQLVRDDCVADYDATFREFWDDARPLFDHVLVWDPTETVLNEIPAYYAPVFHQGKLWLFARQP